MSVLYPDGWTEPTKNEDKRNDNKVRQAVRDIADEITEPLEMHHLVRLISGYVQEGMLVDGVLKVAAITFDDDPAKAIAIAMDKTPGVVRGFDDCASFAPYEVKALIEEVLPEFDDRKPKDKEK